MMQEKKVLFIKGIRDDKHGDILAIRPNNSPMFNTGGSCNVYRFFPKDKIPSILKILDTSARQRLPSKGIALVFNQISDPDSHQTTLLKLHKYLHVNKLPCINEPRQILQTSREKIFLNLQNIERLYVPKSVLCHPRSPKEVFALIKKENMTFPLLFRQAGDHGGVSTELLNGEDETFFYPYALDKRAYYVTQFVEYKEEGIYTKYRIVNVGDELFIRHVIFSDTWMIHSSSREFMAKNKSYENKEKEYIENFDATLKPMIEPIFVEIRKRLKVDYFGVDCCIQKDGTVLVFELNANMNILTDNSKNRNSLWAKQIGKIITALAELVERKLYV